MSLLTDVVWRSFLVELTVLSSWTVSLFIGISIDTVSAFEAVTWVHCRLTNCCPYRYMCTYRNRIWSTEIRKEHINSSLLTNFAFSGAACPQNVLYLDGYPFPMPRPTRISEDCLVLDVWTPSLHSMSRLPVMFWIHGGAFISGNSLIIFSFIILFLKKLIDSYSFVVCVSRHPVNSHRGNR